MHKSHFSLLFIPIFPYLTPLPTLANGFHRPPRKALLLEYTRILTASSGCNDT